MKVVVLGATGPSGLQLVQQGLDRGHSVTAVVRNPVKLQHIRHQNLQVKKVNIMSVEELTKSFADHDAILIALGARKAMPIFGIVTVHTDTIKPIAAAMRNNNIKRVIVISAWTTGPSPHNPWSWVYFINPLFIGRNITNLAEMEAYLNEECQDLDYTVVRPPELSDGDITDAPLLTCEDYSVPCSRRLSVPRADVARFMLDCMENGEWIKKMVAIALDPNK